MPSIKSWNFDNDPQILREKAAALQAARGIARTQRQAWEESYSAEQVALQAQQADTQIKQAELAAKRPLVEAARLQARINQEKLAQKRFALQESQVETGIAADSYQGAVGERSIKQIIIREKLRGLALMASELRASNDATARSLALDYGRLSQVTAAPVKL